VSVHSVLKDRTASDDRDVPRPGYYEQKLRGSSAVNLERLVEGDRELNERSQGKELVE